MRPIHSGSRSSGRPRSATSPSPDTLGATKVREDFYGADVLGHIVMLDPEGNEFCVG
jgi:hypothetical protein